MGYSINKATLLGNAGKYPEVKTFQNGGKVASFSLATSESWTDKQSGEKKSRTEWHSIVIKNDKLVDVVGKYVKKGSKLHIEGKLETRKWTDKDGKDRYTTEIVLYPFSGEIIFLDAKEDADEAPADALPPEDIPY